MITSLQELRFEMPPDVEEVPTCICVHWIQRWRRKKISNLRKSYLVVEVSKGWTEILHTTHIIGLAEMDSSVAREPLFEEICSVDFLNFKFGGRGYQVLLLFSVCILI